MSRFDEIFAAGVLGGTVSGARKGFSPEAAQVKIRPFAGKGETLYQFTYLLPDRASHDNFTAREAAERLDELLVRFGYAQAVLFAASADYHATCYGKLKISAKPPTRAGGDIAAHDKPKPKALDGAEMFLKALGIMSAGGHIVGDMKAKYAQINMFIELAEPFVPKSGVVNIADFGCGKAYLTFALYHHIVFNMGLECRMTGIDLKADVTCECEALARSLGDGYGGLRFFAGDAAELCPDVLDMVITLHACDTATDFALAWAVKRGAMSIVSVPCCQHELFRQVESCVNAPLLRGVLRERTSALVTDAARAALLEAHGYKTELIEFIDSEHTPKNIMLRARKRSRFTENERETAREAYRGFTAAWGIDPTLGRLLDV